MIPEAPPTGRTALPSDEAAVLGLMRDFYAEEHLVFDEIAVPRAVRHLLAAPEHGSVVLFSRDSRDVGYLVLTFGFSLEFHGRFALLDELYLVPAARGRGWGHLALETAAALARSSGVSALRLEVSRPNARARSMYLKSGYKDDRRDLLTRWL